MKNLERLVKAMNFKNLEHGGKFSAESLDLEIKRALQYIGDCSYCIAKVLWENDTEEFYTVSNTKHRDILYWILGALSFQANKKVPLIIEGDDGKKFGFYFE